MIYIYIYNIQNVCHISIFNVICKCKFTKKLILIFSNVESMIDGFWRLSFENVIIHIKLISIKICKCITRNIHYAIILQDKQIKFKIYYCFKMFKV